MKVLIVSSIDTGRVEQIIWQEGVKLVAEKTMYKDGTVEEDATYHDTLLDAANEINGSYSIWRLVDVADLRSAEKYLGKSSDLVNTLPELDIHAPDEPDASAS
jgi:hypothetical protein